MIGQTVGNFRVLRLLGSGGMGDVYLAEQTSVQTQVAIKMLHRDISADRDHVQRFFNEARIVGKIKHSAIVKIFDVGFHADHAYLVMELLEGESLASRIKRSGRLSAPQVASIGRQIASALAATHDAGIIHRDLKPDNIFLVTDQDLGHRERVKILDFGIAKLSGTLSPNSPRTAGTMGTPGYMAPEQWGDSGTVDWRADAYSLGCVAFEMACGRPPFIVHTIADACAAHLQKTPPRARSLVPDLPPTLDTLIDRLLAKDPAKRVGSMVDFARAFETVGGTDAGTSIAETMQPGSSLPEVPARGALATTLNASTGAIESHAPARKRFAIGAAVIGAIVVAAIVLVLATRRESPSPAATPASDAAAARNDPPPRPDAPEIVTTPPDAAEPIAGSGSALGDTPGSASTVAAGSGSATRTRPGQRPRPGSGSAATVTKGSAGGSAQPAGSAAGGAGSAKGSADPFGGRI